MSEYFDYIGDYEPNYYEIVEELPMMDLADIPKDFSNTSEEDLREYWEKLPRYSSKPKKWDSLKRH